MRHAPLDVFAPSCLDMHGEYILTVNVDLIMEEIGIHESLLHSLIQSDISVGALM